MTAKRTLPNRAWAIFFARGVLGLIFFMAGVYKVFQLGPAGHVRRYFLPYQDTFLPTWALWAVGAAIPFVELISGGLPPRWLAYAGGPSQPGHRASGGYLRPPC